MYRRLFAWALDKGGAAHERFIAERKRGLLGRLEGDVLEIGPGTGANLEYYPATARLVGIEPNPHMHKYLRREAERLRREIEIRDGVAERLDVADASVDAVVSTLVLCSVNDQQATLAEVLRVLRPGGRFVFVEHVAAPQEYFERIAPGAAVFVSLPIFATLDAIRGSKHYRPGEHLYYFTHAGFVAWMALYGFRLLEASDHETQAGRDGIMAYAFRRELPGYRDLLAQYRTLHETRHYGASGGLYLEYLAPLVRALDPASILDYGCGRSDLAAHFYADGRRRIARYDPAIGDYKVLPDGPFDLALCIDVMEHIRMADVDRVLHEIRTRAARAVFVISTKPSRAVLPNGMNAHVTLLTKSEWTRWIAARFGRAEAVPTQWDHVLMLKTF